MTRDEFDREQRLISLLEETIRAIRTNDTRTADRELLEYTNKFYLKAEEEGVQ